MLDKNDPRTPLNDIADLVKYHYFTINKELAELQCRLAELTGTGRLDPADNDDLQRHLHNVYEELTGGLTSAVIKLVGDDRFEDTFSDDTEVVVKNQAIRDWPWNEFLWGDGPVVEFPPGCKATINFPPIYAEEAR
jgi:hypothetical protein